ncbi:MAG: photosystem II protein PsbQ [Cyanobacteria bacterium P01_D01_bin.156]
MKRFRSLTRSIVGVFLVAIATLLVSCGGDNVAAPPTYTADQLAQISVYAKRIQTSKDRLPELAGYIRDDNWANIDNFIHGPLGELRTRMNRLAFSLLPDDKADALKLSDEISEDLEAMSAAVGVFDSNRTNQAYIRFAKDLSLFLDSVPKAPAGEDTASIAVENVNV